MVGSCCPKKASDDDDPQVVNRRDGRADRGDAIGERARVLVRHERSAMPGYVVRRCCLHRCVRSIESIDHAELGGPYQSRRVRFDVERGLRGIAPGQSDVVTGMGGGDCGYKFEVGKRYVVYAWRSPEGRLSTGICSRTRPIEAADEDLKYLSSIPPAGSGARIYGRITQLERDPGEDNYVDYGPVEGLLVSAHGTAFTLDATTNKDGRFEILGVPPGRATVSVLPPPVFSSRHLEIPIEIKDPRACTEVSFQVHSDR
jgi:hypothetical protein